MPPPENPVPDSGRNLTSSVTDRLTEEIVAGKLTPTGTELKIDDGPADRQVWIHSGASQRVSVNRPSSRKGNDKQ